MFNGHAMEIATRPPEIHMIDFDGGQSAQVRTNLRVIYGWTLAYAGQPDPGELPYISTPDAAAAGTLMVPDTGLITVSKWAAATSARICLMLWGY